MYYNFPLYTLYYIKIISKVYIAYINVYTWTTTDLHIRGQVSAHASQSSRRRLEREHVPVLLPLLLSLDSERVFQSSERVFPIKKSVDHNFNTFHWTENLSFLCAAVLVEVGEHARHTVSGPACCSPTYVFSICTHVFSCTHTQ